MSHLCVVMPRLTAICSKNEKRLKPSDNERKEESQLESAAGKALERLLRLVMTACKERKERLDASTSASLEQDATGGGL